MIKRQFIEKQVRKSVRTKCTSLFLRRLVFQTVDTVARTHYGHDYADEMSTNGGSVTNVAGGVGYRKSIDGRCGVCSEDIDKRSVWRVDRVLG